MPKKNAFQQAVENTPEISGCYQSGLKALGSNSSKIIAETSRLCGSIELDACVKRSYPNDSRWDYIVCFNFKVIFIEVHGGSTSDVSTMAKKLKWLKRWLEEKAPLINRMKADEKPYYWIQSGNSKLSKLSRQFRQLESLGIKPMRTLRLEKI